MKKIASIQSRQHGVAIVTALLLTTLAVLLVSSLFWQQQVQVRTIENQRLQSQKGWILLGALDWVGVILRADATRANNVDYLGQPWSVPLINSRLDDYVDDSDKGAAALLSRDVIDAQSRYNLSNLTTNGVANPIEMATFKRLLINLQLPIALATTIATAQSSAPQATTGTTTGSLPLLHVEDLLALPDVTPQIVNRLKDFVVILPATTPVNLNTAPIEVLSACFESLSQSDAASLIASRSTAYFRDAADFASRLSGNKAISATSNSEPVTFSTSFFLVNNKVRMGRMASDTVSLIRREANLSTVLWTKEQ